MKNFSLLCISLLCLLYFSTAASALELGTNITIFDGQSSSSNTWYTGQGQGNEDNETEPGTSRENKWDLEGMFISGTTLTMVGEWDFVNGEKMEHDWELNNYDRDGDGYYTSGDLFIDVHGVSTNSYYGYDYVFDIDWTSPGRNYTIFSLADTSHETDYLKTTYRQESNPWKVSSTDNLTSIASGNFTLSSGLSNDATGFDGDNSHYAVGFDLMPILSALNMPEMSFTAHFTMECGNDNLMGQGIAPVPEPATIILMGCGLIGIAGITRKKFVS